MTQKLNPLLGRRNPVETANLLYQGVFAAQTQDDQELASEIWLALEPRDRSFIATHLQYLNLLAQARTHRLLQAIRETLDNIAGASIAIADVVTGQGQGTPVESSLESEGAEGGAPSSNWEPIDEDWYQPVENPVQQRIVEQDAPDPLIIQDLEEGDAVPTPEPATSTAAENPKARRASLADAFPPSSGSRGSKARTSERRRPAPTEAPSKPEPISEEPHVE